VGTRCHETSLARLPRFVFREHSKIMDTLSGYRRSLMSICGIVLDRMYKPHGLDEQNERGISCFVQ